MRIFCLFLVIIAIAPVLASDYTVSSFVSEKTIPAAENFVIAPLSGEAIAPQAEPKAGPGQLLLRRKFGPDEYGLFLGKLKPGAYEKLSVFSLPSGISLEEAARLKFYTSEDQKNFLEYCFPRNTQLHRNK